jgi:hypothetical protein
MQILQPGHCYNLSTKSCDLDRHLDWTHNWTTHTVVPVARSELVVQKSCCLVSEAAQGTLAMAQWMTAAAARHCHWQLLSFCLCARMMRGVCLVCVHVLEV